MPLLFHLDLILCVYFRYVFHELGCWPFKVASVAASVLLSPSIAFIDIQYCAVTIFLG